MKQYRIKEIDGKYYPQERFCFFFWEDIKLRDRVSRDWFVTSIQDNKNIGPVKYFVAKDAWGVIHWFKPEFVTLERAKLFIEEYKKFLYENHQKQNAKYYY